MTELEKYLNVFSKYGWNVERIGTSVLLTLETKPKKVFAVSLLNTTNNVDIDFYYEDGSLEESIFGGSAGTPEELHTLLSDLGVPNLPSKDEKLELLHLAVFILNRGLDFKMMTLENIINSLPDVSAFYYAKADQVSEQMAFAKRSGFHLILSAGDYHLQQERCVLRSAIDDKAPAKTVRLADLPRILADYQDNPELLLSLRNRTNTFTEGHN